MEALPVVPQGLPNSARQVFDTLATRGPLTHKDLVRVTGMPGRTVRYAVGRLKEAGVLTSRHNLQDCRQCFFFVDCHSDPKATLEGCPVAKGPDIVVRTRP
ncbi:MAG TPA: helix-turn-helix domain-containing protein [Candidatus Thermoplasmatota archaeon]|nr:helix-turn-helix domain-containing protein [Candidatus Thermoplasmatota archaeon]